MRRFFLGVLGVALAMTLAGSGVVHAQSQCGPNGCRIDGRSTQAMYAAPLYAPQFHAPTYAPTSCPVGGSCAPGACASGACATTCPAGSCGLSYAHVHLAPAVQYYAAPQYEATSYGACGATAPARRGFRLFGGRGLKGLFGGCCGG